MKALMKCRQVGLFNQWEPLLCIMLYSSSLPVTSRTHPHSDCVSGLVDQSLLPSNPRPPPHTLPATNLTKDFSSDNLLALSSLGHLAHQS